MSDGERERAEVSWSGSLQHEQSDVDSSAEAERWTGPVAAGDLAEAAADAGAPDAPVGGEKTGMGLAELLEAEDVGRAGPAVLGADPAPGGTGEAGEWPTLQRRERRSRPEPEEERPRSGPLGWLRRRG